MAVCSRNTNVVVASFGGMEGDGEGCRSIMTFLLLVCFIPGVLIRLEAGQLGNPACMDRRRGITHKMRSFVLMRHKLMKMDRIFCCLTE